MSGTPAAAGGFDVALVNKHISIGPDGFLRQIVVDGNEAAFGQRNAVSNTSLLQRPMGLRLMPSAEEEGASSNAGPPLEPVVVRPATAESVERNQTGVYWNAQVAYGNAVLVDVFGSVEYDSFMEFRLELSSSSSSSSSSTEGEVRLADVQLTLDVVRAAARFMCGFGVEGVHTPTEALSWNWKLGQGNNMVWIGRPEYGY